MFCYGEWTALREEAESVAARRDGWVEHRWRDGFLEFRAIWEIYLGSAL